MTMKLRRYSLPCWRFVVAGEASAQTREQVVRIPAAGGVSMLATVMRPPGEDNASRWSSSTTARRPTARSDATMAPPRYEPPVLVVRRARLRRRPAAAPRLRRHRRRPGPKATATATKPDYYNAGLRGAADIQAALDYMRSQPYVAADRSLVVGQSAGGWATLAFSSQQPGGRAGHDRLRRRPRRPSEDVGDGSLGNCTPNALVSAAGKYGATARVPMLWIYTANDSFFEPEPRAAHVRRLQQRRRQGHLSAARRLRQRRPQPRRRATAAWRCGRARSRSSWPPSDRVRSVFRQARSRASAAAAGG